VTPGPGPLSRRALLRVGGAGLAGRAPAQTPPPPPRPAPPAAPPRQTQSAPAPAAPPGTPAPADVVAAVRATLTRAIERFEAKDLEGVLAHVSEAYWTGPLTKRTVRAQLLTLFQVNQQVRARVRLDEVRLVGPHAWVWTTGDVAGLLPLVNQWVALFVWERELEVARRENGAWRLYGYQQ
jgi:hypothetical protein